MRPTGSHRSARPRSLTRRLAALLGSVALVLGLTTVMAPAAGADDPGDFLTVTKNVDKAEIGLEDTLVYTIEAQCDQTSCIDADLLDSFPAGLDGFDLLDVAINYGEVDPSHVAVEWSTDSGAAWSAASPAKITGAVDGTTQFRMQFRDPEIDGDGIGVDDEGLQSGKTVTVQIELRAPADAEPGEYTIVNPAGFTATNALPESDSATTTLKVDTVLAVGLDKNWTPATDVAATGTASVVTLTATNGSNIDVDTLVIQEPQDSPDGAATLSGSNPFTVTELDSFTVTPLPSGADQARIDAYVWDDAANSGSGGYVWQEGTAAATPGLPAGVGAADVAGIRITYSNSSPATKIGKSAGATVVLDLKQSEFLRDAPATRVDAAAHEVDNTAVATVSLGAETSAPGTGSASYTITPPTIDSEPVKVVGGSFTQQTISAGESTTATITGSNTSTVKVHQLRLADTGFFTEEITFGGFTGDVTYPVGATVGKVVYHFATAADEEVDFASGATPGNPTTDLTSDYVTGFELVFTGAADTDGIERKDDGGTVTATYTIDTTEDAAAAGTPVTRTNTLETTVELANGRASDPKPDTADLTVVYPAVEVELDKTILPTTPVHPGERVVTELMSTLTTTSDYVDATTIVITDAWTGNGGFWDAFDIESVAPTQVFGNMDLTVEVTTDQAVPDGSTTWTMVKNDTGAGARLVTVSNSEIAAAIAPGAASDVTGIRFLFEAKPGQRISDATAVTAHIVSTARSTLRSGATPTSADDESPETYVNTATTDGHGKTQATVPTDLHDDDDASSSATIVAYPAGTGTGPGADVHKNWHEATIQAQSGLTETTTLGWRVWGDFDTVTISDPSVPADDGAGTVFDAFDLTEIKPVGVSDDPFSNGWYLKYDTVTEIKLCTDAATCTEVTAPGGSWHDADRSFKGYELTEAQRNTTVGVQIVLEEYTAGRTAAAAEGADFDPYAPLDNSGVANSSANRTFDLVWQIRNTQRSEASIWITKDTSLNHGDAGWVENTVEVRGAKSGQPDVTDDADASIQILNSGPGVAVAKTAKNSTGGVADTDPLYTPLTGTVVPGGGTNQTAQFVVTGHNDSIARASYVRVMDMPACSSAAPVADCYSAGTTAAALADPYFDGGAPTFAAADHAWLQAGAFDRLDITNITIAASKADEVSLADSVVWLLTYGTTDGYRSFATYAQAVNAAPAGGAITIGGDTIPLADIVGVSVTFQGEAPSTTGGTIMQDNNLTITIDARVRTTVRSTGEPQKLAVNKLEPATNRSFAQSYDPVLADTVQTGDRDFAAVNLTGGALAVAATKSFSQATVTAPQRDAGHEVTVTIGANSADSTLGTTQVTITDDEPAFWQRFDLAELVAGSITPPNGADRVAVDVKTSGGWTNENATPIATAALPAGITPSAVTGVRFTFTNSADSILDNNVPAAAWTAEAKFKVTVRDTLRSGGALDMTVDDTVTNKVVAESLRTVDDVATADNTADIVLTPGTARLAINKITDPDASGAPRRMAYAGSLVPFRLTVRNDGTGYLDIAEVRDTLPDHLAYTGEEPVYTKDVAGLLSEDVTMVTDGDDLVFTWPASGHRMQPGETFVVDLKLELQPGLTAGQQTTNTMTVTTDQALTDCVNTRGAQSVEFDFAAGPNVCKTSDVVGPRAGVAFFNVKGVIGSRDGAATAAGVECEPRLAIGGDTYYRSPCAANSAIGGTDHWVLHNVNAGTEPIDGMTIFDQLPESGDVLIIGGATRKSDYRPQLTAAPAVIAPAGTTHVIEVVTDPGACTGTWDTLATGGAVCEQNGEVWEEADLDTAWDSVRGLRISFDFAGTTDGELKPGQAVTVTFSTRNVQRSVADPSGAPTAELPDGVYAWNQFGAQYHVVGEANNRRQAPDKVGVKLYYAPVPPGGGGDGPGPSTSPSPSPSPGPTTSTSPATPATPGPSTSTVPSVPTVTPSSATNPTRPVPPTNRPPVTVEVGGSDECADLQEEGFEPGETVTITVTGENGQYGITAVADDNGTVRFCLQADEPQELVIEILGENQTTVRKVTIGVDGKLPHTGVAMLPMIAIALALLGAGAFAMAFGSRRRGSRGNHA